MNDTAAKGTIGIQALADRTGLTPHVIRAWERRYGLGIGGRSESNRRLYTEEDARRLALLARLRRAGHSLPRIAHLSDEELGRLSTEEGVADRRASLRQAILDYDAIRLRRLLEDRLAKSGARDFVANDVLPLLRWIDGQWSETPGGIASEHLATAAIRSVLDDLRSDLAAPPGAPLLLVTTPRGQHHELGALLVAIEAALRGWQVVYLGPNLPAAEIGIVVRRTGAEALALSIVYPTDDLGLPDELRAIREEVGPHVRVVAGGRGAVAYAEDLKSIGARIGDDLGFLQVPA